MNVHVDFYKILLDSILDDRNIKAAIVVDAKGRLVQKAGNAMCLKNSSEEDQTAMVTRGLENIYIKEIGDFFAIAVFDEKMSFEAIKANVDAKVARFKRG